MRDRGQRRLGISDGVQQRDGVEPGAVFAKRVLDRIAHPLVGEQAFTRCSGLPVSLRNRGADARLGNQLERRLEEIHVQPHRAAQVSQSLSGHGA